MAAVIHLAIAVCKGNSSNLHCVRRCPVRRLPTQSGMRQDSTEFQSGNLPGCNDEHGECAALAAQGGCFNGSDAPLRCPTSCGTCGFEEEVNQAFGCEDTHSACAYWARAGECNKSVYIDYMVCERKRLACRRMFGASPAVKRGSINALMRRILSDFPQYSPEALSWPGGGDFGPMRPWVMRLHNFLTDDEVEVFIRQCSGEFQRSLAGKGIHSACGREHSVKAIERRIANVTGVPSSSHFEWFQVLRYLPGQHYQQHHDQQTGFWTPQGARVLTFFLYLSTPKGGGTFFNKLGLNVPAIKGSALLWPSVMDTNPDVDEPNTWHEGLPPEAGSVTKYAANVWIHNFDYRTPYRRGCPLVGVHTHYAS